MSRKQRRFLSCLICLLLLFISMLKLNEDDQGFELSSEQRTEVVSRWNDK